MILLNFSHPLTDEQLGQIEALTGQQVAEVRDVPAQFDKGRAFPEQVRLLVDSIELSPREWQTLPILINPPGYNFAALTLLAELHGRTGYFPAILRIREIINSTPLRYEVAEIINLQTVRQAARETRKE